MKILITGAAGYIGSFLAQRLISENHKIRLIDNYYIPSNITEIDGIPIENRDIRDDIDISDIDVIFHLAAISGIKRCADDENAASDTNVKGTYNLLKTLKGKVIFASTAAVYGICQTPEIDETHTIIPRSIYGTTKLEAERVIRLAEKFVILRFSNVYGKGITCKRTVIDMFIERALKKLPLEIFGDGKQRRDFVHINDVIRAYFQAMNSNTNGIYNIGGNQALSVNDITELVIKCYRRMFGLKLGIRYLPDDKGAKWKDFLYSSTKSKQRIHYEPLYSVEEEIRSRFNAHNRKNI